MINPRHLTFTSIILFIAILVFGFVNKPEYKENLNWSDRLLEWNDFPEVEYIEGDFHAYVNSEIHCPKNITKSNSKIYAYMNPNLSGRLKDSVFDSQLLIHEQYHFNITEYHARLLRKAIVEMGLEGISKSKIKSLHKKYYVEKEKMQDEYDSISNHNTELQKQRYWELKIDDLLRKTAYYQNPDIYSYHDFTKGETKFYKHIYYTFDHKILTSYPISKDNLNYGESYEVVKDGKNVIVKFYKNGKLFNGGYFNTSIVKIDYSTNTAEVHYYNPDSTYNTSRPYCILKSVRDDSGDKIIYYLNEKRERVSNKKIYEVQWDYLSDGSFYASYFNKNRFLVDNEDGVRHEKRSFDYKGRTNKIESFDANHKPMLDKNYVAINEFVFDNDHKIIQDKSLNKKGKFAIYLDDYYQEYIYDERGNLSKSFNLDINGNKTIDKTGVCIKEYTYDLFDNATSISRYNEKKVPILGTDDYFKLVMDYDSLGRDKFNASYRPGYILNFDDTKNGATKYEHVNDSLVLEYNVDGFNQVFNNDTGIAIIKKYLNNKKQVIKDEYLDYEKNYAKPENKVVSNHNKYDKVGNMIEQTSLDSLGNVTPFESDVAIIRWEYDERNNKTKTTYYNKHNILAKEAVQNIIFNVYKYNKKNQLIQRMDFNQNMKPELYNGAHKMKFYFNKIGKDSLVKEYDKNHNLINGACITKYDYDKYGNDLSTMYFDASYKRIKNSNGVSRIQYNYDNKRRYIGYSYFDEFDQPVNSLEGYHKKVFLLNAIGESVRISTYGANALLVENKEGIAEYEYIVEKSGLASSVKYYDKNHQLVNDSQGVAQILYSPSLNGLYYVDKELNAKGEEVKDNEEQ